MTKLNLGSGFRKLEGHVNIDNREVCNPDIVWDLTQRLPFDDNTVDEVRAYDILEHMPQGKVINLIEEIYRVLKVDGVFESFTPSTDGRGAFQDFTHTSFLNINSHLYWTNKAYRELYDTKALFDIIKLYDVWTDKENRVIHTHAILKKIEY